MATTVILPPSQAIEAAAAELDKAAVEAQSVKRQIAVSKAAYDLLVNAPVIARISGAYLVPSTSQAGLIHRVDDIGGCTCPAGQRGHECRHKVALEIIEAAAQRTMPNLVDADRAAKIARAKAAADALNECFA